MIALSRPLAGRFRAVARRCVVGRPRGPSPPVVLERHVEAVSLRTHLGNVALGVTEPSVGGPAEIIAVPASLLDEIASARDGLANIVVETEEGLCRWDGRETRWPRIDPYSVGESLMRPKVIKGVEASFLTALHECGRSAARDDVRYALSRMQIQGKAGKIVGTDGRQLLIWGGWDFPFEESVLVPAVPAFACRELAAESDVRVGLIDRHFVVTAGPWTVWLAIDREGRRFPDVEAVVPRKFKSELHISKDDQCRAARMLKQIARTDDDAPDATVEFGNPPALRTKADESGRTSEILLDHSSATGDPVSIVINRDHLVRAWSLGFDHLATPSEDGPVVFRDPQRTYVTTTLHASRKVMPAVSRPPRSIMAAKPPTSPHSVTGDPMPSEHNGRVTPEPASPEEIDFLAEAEGLRDALGEVGRRAARLVGLLKNLQKQRRMLQTAWSSLKNLRLGS